MNIRFLFPLLALLSLIGCIGDDFLLDNIDEAVRITNPIDSLQIGDDYQFEATYFNQIGLEEMQDISWRSTDAGLIELTSEGLATGLAEGEALVEAYAVLTNGDTIQDRISVIVNEDATSSQTLARTGRLMTTSSYALEGTFTLSEESGTVILKLGEDYKASSALPGLYVYLTNNPATNQNALEIGKVTIFSGAHSYEVSGTDLNEYSHILYYCKPFGVKVGDGAFDE